MKSPQNISERMNMEEDTTSIPGENHEHRDIQRTETALITEDLKIEIPLNNNKVTYIPIYGFSINIFIFLEDSWIE